jgi:hypothetical protein
VKWLIVVVFATSAGDVYIFNKPVFDTQEECRYSLKVDAQDYIQKLIIEYGGFMPVLAVDCLTEDTIQEILDSQQDTDI